MLRILRAIRRQFALGAFQLIDRLRSQPHRYILILSHMRSGSTLLLHLLMTSPQINSMGESSNTYSSRKDLALLALKCRLARFKPGGFDYSLDQLNHNHLIRTRDLLCTDTVYPIVLVRKPRDAIASMVTTFGRTHEYTADEAAAHYRDRVSSLAHDAGYLHSHGRVLLLTYDELVNDTRHTLQRLEEYLELSSGLSETYATYGFTGARGDRSGRITEGRVLPAVPSRHVAMDEQPLKELDRLFDACIAAARE